jgi:hypothetical protein
MLIEIAAMINSATLTPFGNAQDRLRREPNYVFAATAELGSRLRGNRVVA